MGISTALKAIADSIRIKTGTTDTMKLEEMPALIDCIETGGSGINPEWTDWSYFSCNNNRNELLAKLKYSDTSKGTVFKSFVVNCSGITEMPEFDTSEGEIFQGMFSGCTSLVKIPMLNMSKSLGNTTAVQSMFSNCGALEYVRFQDKEGNTEGCFPVKANMTSLFSACPNLTVDSLMSFINALTNIGTSTYTVTIGSTNLAKLTSEQKAVATAKNITLA